MDRCIRSPRSAARSCSPRGFRYRASRGRIDRAMVPSVTIAMPAFNEEHYIEACIASVQAQDYPRDRMEILIADGRSTDRTRDILARLAADDPRIKMVDNPARLPA